MITAETSGKTQPEEDLYPVLGQDTALLTSCGEGWA